MNIAQVVQVIIRIGLKTITRAGFGTCLVVGSNGDFTGIRTYNDIDGVAEDFTTSDAEYIAADRLFGQENRPTQIKIAKRTANVAQIETLTPNVSVQAIAAFTVTINGVLFSFTSDSDPTAGEVVAGLIAEVNGGTEPVTASGTTTLILTADQAGIPFTLSNSANMGTAVHTAVNNGIVEDLIDFDEVDKDWYALVITSRDVEEIFIAAKWIETKRKFFAFATSQADILTPGNTTNIFSRLKVLLLKRTEGIFSADQDQFPDAALFGNVLPRNPGSYTEAYKFLSGITPDALTSTEETSIFDKGGNIYTELGGQNIYYEGKTFSGDFADTQRFADWLQAQIEEAIYAKLVSLPKVPFTNAGVDIFVNEVKACLQRGIRFGGLAEDPPPTVTAPNVLTDLTEEQRQSRVLPDIKFHAQLAGAIHRVTNLEGTLSF